MKAAVLTGASGGMGSAAAAALVKEGYFVFALDSRETNSREGVEFIRTDLTDAASVRSAFDFVRSKTDGIDCIVNMAGLYDLDSLVEISEERFLRSFNVNLFAVYRVNKAFLPLLREGGRVVITTSELAPLDPLPFTGLYAITKAALEKYAASLRMELQLIGRKVIVIRPGAVDTPLIGASTRALEAFQQNTKLYSCNAERFRRVVDGVEARRMPPERIAKLLVRALKAKRPKYVYKINRNPLLLILNALPDRLQCAAIRWILKPKDE